MANIVRRITIIEKDANGVVNAETFYKKKNSRKRSAWAKPLEKAHRRSLKASKIYVSELMGRNERSSKKKKDGWIRDAGLNNLKAARKAYRKLS